MAVDLAQLLDPKRAEREEGWHDFAKSYERSMLDLTKTVAKLSGERRLDKGESAFIVLEQYIEEQRNKAELDREKAARLHDMVMASVPEVTAEQKAAYEAQKKLYDHYQDELKKQTKAVEDEAKARTSAIESSTKAQTKAIESSAKSQIAAIDKEEKRQLALVDAQAAQLKRTQGGDISKSIDELIASGEGAAKSGGKDTLVSTLLASSRDFLGKKQAEREALIDEAAELQREGIRSESAARKGAIDEEKEAQLGAIREEKEAQLSAIKEESRARIAAITEEIQLQARLANATEAPIKPEQARANLIAETEKALAGNEKFIEKSARSRPKVAKQQAELQRELYLEAMEEQGGEFLAPAITEDELPGIAAPAPFKVEPEAKVAEDTGKNAGAANVIGGLIDVGGKGVGASLTGSMLGSAGSMAAGAGAAGAVGGGLAAIASSVGSLVPAVTGIALPLTLGMQALEGINSVLPVATTALGALGEGSKLLGPIILSAAMEVGGYIMNIGANLAEKIERLKFSDTRMERLEKSGAIGEAHEVAKAEREAKAKTLDRALSSSLDVRYGSAAGSLQRVETPYTTPANERRLSQPEPQPNSAPDLQQAITAMAEAQEQAARRQAELGQGAVPLQFSVPALESFNM